MESDNYAGLFVCKTRIHAPWPRISAECMFLRAHSIIIRGHGRKVGIARDLICMSNPILAPPDASWYSRAHHNSHCYDIHKLEIYRSSYLWHSSIPRDWSIDYSSSRYGILLESCRTHHIALTYTHTHTYAHTLLCLELLRFWNNHTRTRSRDRSLIVTEVIKVLYFQRWINIATCYDDVNIVCCSLFERLIQSSIARKTASKCLCQNMDCTLAGSPRVYHNALYSCESLFLLRGLRRVREMRLVLAGKNV